MKVYISADLEGIGGVVLKEQTIKGNQKYEEACRLLGREVYSMVEGLTEAGVEKVVVYDAHGNGFNINYDDMHPKAEYLMGFSHPEVRFPFLDSSFDFIILQGYHAMSGTKGAVLAHSYSSSAIHSIYVNGKEAGEIYIDALAASEFGVPVALVTGDDKTIQEASEFMPWIKTYETKKSVAYQCALIKPPSLVRSEIKDIAFSIVQEKKSFKTLDLPENYEIETEFYNVMDADSIVHKENSVVRADGRTIVKKGKKIWETMGK